MQLHVVSLLLQPLKLGLEVGHISAEPLNPGPPLLLYSLVGLKDGLGLFLEDPGPVRLLSQEFQELFLKLLKQGWGDDSFQSPGIVFVLLECVKDGGSAD